MLTKKRKRTDDDRVNLKRKRSDDGKEKEDDCNVLKKKQKYYCIYEEYTKYKRQITMYI